MPHPAPPAPRISYDDPSIANVFFNRRYLSKRRVEFRDGTVWPGTDNPAMWQQAEPDALTYMNAAGHAYGYVPNWNTPDSYSGTAGSVNIPYDAVWLGESSYIADGDVSTDDYLDMESNIFQVTFQDPYRISGIEIVVAAMNNDADFNQPTIIDHVSLRYVKSGSDPFGSDYTYYGPLLPPPAKATLVANAGFDSAPLVDLPSSVDTQSYSLSFTDSPSSVEQMDLRDVTALRFSFVPRRDGYSGGSSAVPQMIKLHIYGRPEHSKYLDFISPTLSTSLDSDGIFFGDVVAGSSSDKSFRIKNFSPDQTANSVVISAENGPGYESPTPADSLLFSIDGITWTPTVSLTSIASGSISPIIQVRRVTPVTSELGNTFPRVRAETGSWT